MRVAPFFSSRTRNRTSSGSTASRNVFECVVHTTCIGCEPMAPVWSTCEAARRPVAATTDASLGQYPPGRPSAGVTLIREPDNRRCQDRSVRDLVGLVPQGGVPSVLELEAIVAIDRSDFHVLEYRHEAGEVVDEPFLLSPGQRREQVGQKRTRCIQLVGLIRANVRADGGRLQQVFSARNPDGCDTGPDWKSLTER